MKITSLVFSLLIVLAQAAFGQDADKQPASPGGTTETVDRELKVGDRLAFYIEEDPVPGVEAMGVIITEIGDGHFSVSRGTDKKVTVPCKGRKISEVKNDVVRKLESDFYQKATVSLSFYESRENSSSASSGRVLFRGEVNGTVYPLSDNKKTMLSEAILEMGPKDYANLKKVKLTRKDPVTGKTETKTIDIDGVINKNRTDDDVELKDGDRVEVPVTLFKARK